MDFDAVLLSRFQFAFVIAFHIIFPAFHHRARRMAGDYRGGEAGDREFNLPERVRLLAEGVRAVVRHGRGHRNRHGVSVRHQLERAGGAKRTDYGAAAGI